MTLVPNEFLDRYMSRANGEFVKVYLLLLRMSASGQSFSLSDAADILSCTEKDIVRALRYWENSGVLILTRDKRDKISAVAFAPIGMQEADTAGGYVTTQKAAGDNAPSAGNPGTAEGSYAQVQDTAQASIPGRDDAAADRPGAEAAVMPTRKQSTSATVSGSGDAAAAVPERKQLTAARISELEHTEDFMYLIFVSGQYLGRTLTRRDIDTLGYFFDELHMSVDLIEYLIEYCVSGGHNSIRYIETVGLDWHKSGIKTVLEARETSGRYQKDYYTIMKALGIRDHSPISEEIRIMDKWMNEYRFTMDLICEACTRTIMTTAKPTIRYADGILSKWFEKKITTLEDVKKEDEIHRAKQEDGKKKKSSGRQKGKTPSGNFYQFEQRTYDTDLETRLLGISDP